MSNMLRNRKGFTLVEMALVLVIIGIILGAVLKGQEIIKTAKYKRLYNTYRELIAATYTYYDKYQAYPGDDNTAQTRWPTAANGNANGYVDGAGGAGNVFCTTAVAGQTAGANGRIAPKHVFGGGIGVIRTSTIFGAGTWNKPFAVCFQNLTNETASWLDTSYDDGVYNTGSIRGNGDYMTLSPDLLSAAYVCIEG
jgi:prepilin-type N-terminal cleavage/methylation domain-containing protein